VCDATGWHAGVFNSRWCGPVDDESFDVVTISFGIRNVTRIEKCLQQVMRVSQRNCVQKAQYW
jgi:hypothetical protein